MSSEPDNWAETEPIDYRSNQIEIEPDAVDNWEDLLDDEEEEESEKTEQESKLSIREKNRQEKKEKSTKNTNLPNGKNSVELTEGQKRDAQLSSDLNNALELFGVSEQEFKTRDQFDTLRKSIVDRFTSLEKSPFYFEFIESLIRDLAAGLSTDQLRKLASSVSVLASLKGKDLKKTAKKKTGIKLVKDKGFKDDVFDDGSYAAGTANDYVDDDFM